MDKPYEVSDFQGQATDTRAACGQPSSGISEAEYQGIKLREQDRRLFVIEDRLRYHAPTSSQIPKYQALRDGALAFAKVIVRNTPDNVDSHHAIEILEAALMTANKSIALGR